MENPEKINLKKSGNAVNISRKTPLIKTNVSKVLTEPLEYY